MKIVLLIIMLAFDPQPIILQVAMSSMAACQTARKAMPKSVNVKVEDITYNAKVLGATCKRVPYTAVDNRLL